MKRIGYLLEKQRTFMTISIERRGESRNRERGMTRLNANTPLISPTGIKNKPAAQHKQSKDNQLFFNILLYTSNKEK